jgi:hypothetical protein
MTDFQGSVRPTGFLLSLLSSSLDDCACLGATQVGDYASIWHKTAVSRDGLPEVIGASENLTNLSLPLRMIISKNVRAARMSIPSSPTSLSWYLKER